MFTACLSTKPGSSGRQRSQPLNQPPGGTYGAADPIFGPRASSYACQKCPLHMTTADTNPSSATEQAAAVVNGGAASCLSKPGYGFNSSVGAAYRCTAGSYSEGYARDPCASCPGNMTTADTDPSLTAQQQAAIVNNAETSCVTLPGYGFDSGAGAAYRCTDGTYSEGYSRDPCTACPVGTTTADTNPLLSSEVRLAVVNTGLGACITL